MSCADDILVSAPKRGLKSSRDFGEIDAEQAYSTDSFDDGFRVTVWYLDRNQEKTFAIHITFVSERVEIIRVLPFEG